MIDNIKKNWFLYLMGVIILFIIIKIVRDMRTPPPPPSTGGGGSTSSSTGAIDYDKMLSVGSSGNEVVVLQNMLNANGQNIVADGQFGQATLAALQAVTSLNEITLNTFISVASGTASGGAVGGGTPETSPMGVPWYMPGWGWVWL